jgi:hypothetical protein
MYCLRSNNCRCNPCGCRQKFVPSVYGQCRPPVYYGHSPLFTDQEKAKTIRSFKRLTLNFLVILDGVASLCFSNLLGFGSFSNYTYCFDDNNHRYDELIWQICLRYNIFFDIEPATDLILQMLSDFTSDRYFNKW